MNRRAIFRALVAAPLTALAGKVGLRNLDAGVFTPTTTDYPEWVYTLPPEWRHPQAPWPISTYWTTVEITHREEEATE